MESLGQMGRSSLQALKAEGAAQQCALGMVGQSINLNERLAVASLRAGRTRAGKCFPALVNQSLLPLVPSRACVVAGDDARGMRGM